MKEWFKENLGALIALGILVGGLVLLARFIVPKVSIDAAVLAGIGWGGLVFFFWALLDTRKNKR